MNRHLSLAILAFLFCMAALLSLLGLGRGCSRSIHDASLVFIGLTNIPTKGERAIFSCTNGSAKSICFLVENFDTSSSGSWETHRLDNGDLKGGMTDEAKRWLSAFIGTPTRLGPNEGATFYVPLPV